MTNLERTLLAMTLVLPGLAPGQTPPEHRRSAADVIFPGFYEHLKQQDSDVKAGVEAEERGDYAGAETLYRRACTAMGWDEPFEHIHLARLFDKTGNGPKAYAEYRIVMAKGKRSFSSQQIDANLLAHFGDLCLKYGTANDACEAYALAVVNGGREFSPETLTATARNDSLTVLKSAAHTASAIKYEYHGQSSASLDELETAVLADGGNWIARIYRANAYQEAGRKAEAVRDVTAAERLVSVSDREALHKMRWFYRLADEGGKVPSAPVLKGPGLPLKGATKP